MIPWCLTKLLIMTTLLSVYCLGQGSEIRSPTRNQADSTGNSSTMHRLSVLPAEWLIGPYISRSKRDLHPLTNAERRQIYVRQTFLNAGAYATRMFTAGIDQARGEPDPWGSGIDGYGRRLASRYGKFVISNTIQATGNAVLGYEPRYDLCTCKGFWPRTRHAIIRNFVTYNETESELRPQIALYAGALGSGMLSSIWLPEHRNVWRDGAKSMLGQVYVGVGVNLLREFAVDILHRVDRRKYPPKEP